MTTNGEINAVVTALGRPFWLGAIRGGPGSFIGAIRRSAAELDGRFPVVAGGLSSEPAAMQSAPWASASVAPAALVKSLQVPTTTSPCAATEKAAYFQAFYRLGPAPTGFFIGRPSPQMLRHHPHRMLRVSLRTVMNLVPAACTVGNDDRIGCVADCG